VSTSHPCVSGVAPLLNLWFHGLSMRKMTRFYGALGMTVLCGCAVARTAKRSEAKLALLKTGDSREQVIQKLGPPALTLSTPVTTAVEYDQYRLFPKKLSRFVLFSGLPSATIAWWDTKIWEAEANVYWLKYAGNKLEKWGPQADFAAELSTTSTSTSTTVAISSPTPNAVTVSTSAVVVSSTSVVAPEISTITVSTTTQH
jgi:hypothetical protein